MIFDISTPIFLLPQHWYVFILLEFIQCFVAAYSPPPPPPPPPPPDHNRGIVFLYMNSCLMLLLGMFSCASYVSRIFELARRSKAPNIENDIGYLSGIFNFRYHFRWEGLSRAQNCGHFENFEILNTAAIWPQIWKDRPKLCQKISYWSF